MQPATGVSSFIFVLPRRRALHSPPCSLQRFLLLRCLLPRLIVVATEVDPPPLRCYAQAAPPELCSAQGPLRGVAASLHDAGYSLLDLSQFVDASLNSLYITFPRDW